MKTMRKMKQLIKAMASLSLIGLFVIFAVASGDDETRDTEKAKKENRVVNVGEVMTSDYFEITVNDVALYNELTSGNPYIDEDGEKEEGMSYLIFSITLKNIDEESRTMTGEGDLVIHSGGKDYAFEKSETLLKDGYGVFLKTLNPMTKVTTKLVFKIPDELSGEVYWMPNRDSKDQMFYLGKTDEIPRTETLGL